jgi:hypothetical protein
MHLKVLSYSPSVHEDYNLIFRGLACAHKLNGNIFICIKDISYLFTRIT